MPQTRRWRSTTCPRRTMVMAAGLALAAGPPGCAARAPEAAPPNVVFILADDIGYGDIGAYGGRVPTPNIDRLAREGMRFTDAHSPAALCAPSRYSLITGSNPYRNGRPGGSWNINFSCAFHAGADSISGGEHATLADSAVGFIERHLAQNEARGERRPFMLYYSSEAIHVPHTPPIHFGDGGDPEVAGTTGGVTSDMIVSLDLQVGRILECLDARGLTRNTIVIFTSDNGALWPDVVDYGDPAHDNNGPFRDYKASVYEGGHRVPFIVRWGDGAAEGSRIAPGTESDALVLAHDWVASMYDLTGQDMPEDQAMDSATLLPLLFGRQPEGSMVHEFVIYQAGFAYDGAIRRGDWVLLVDRENQATELYDLSADPAQERNLIADPAHAERVTSLREEFLTYNDHDDTTREPRTTQAFRAAQRTPVPR